MSLATNVFVRNFFLIIEYFSPFVTRKFGLEPYIYWQRTKPEPLRAEWFG
jgi:hypothetical protein